jgi:hypothetical protein
MHIVTLTKTAKEHNAHELSPFMDDLNKACLAFTMHTAMNNKYWHAVPQGSDEPLNIPIQNAFEKKDQALLNLLKDSPITFDMFEWA